MNHMGKLLFQWFYWHVLLPGRNIPGHLDTDVHGRQDPAHG